MKNGIYWGTVMIACLMLGTSCGRMYVERNSAFKEGPSIKKIVSLDPSFVYVDHRKSKEDLYLDTDSLEREFNQRLISHAAIAKIELEIVDGDDLGSSDISYFNDILPLKQQIFAANFLQEVKSRTKGPISFRRFRPRTKPNSWEFAISPSFDPAFGKLSDAYGTPYFAIHGLFRLVEKSKPRLGLLIFLLPIGLVDLFIPENQTVFYAALVNIENGKVLYREVREINGPINQGVINSMLYDSFTIMKHKIK